MIDKKILYVDMDGVLANFGNEVKTITKLRKELGGSIPKHFDNIPHIFRDLEPIEGSIEAIQKLYDSGKYDMFIATTSPWNNETGASDKVEWLKKYFGDIFKKKIFITHRKDLLIGDILIDDRLKNGAEQFKGELLRFGYDYENKKMNEYPDWDSVLKKLL